MGFLKKAAGALGSAVKVAGPAVAGFAAGGPVGAGLAVVGQVAGAGEKRRGKRRERPNGVVSTNAPVHKATAPAAAVAAPTVAAAILAQLGVGPDVADVLCQAGPAAQGAVYGALAVLAHTAGHGLQDATRTR